MSQYYIGIDLGGTNIAAGIVTAEGKIIQKSSVPTPKGVSAAEIVQDMAKLVQALLQDANIGIHQIVSIGLGVPGTVNKATGVVEYANNLGFYNDNIVEMLQKYFPGKKIFFDNDANAAAWGEFIIGCGKGSKSMIAVTLGTGVGGGIVLDGNLYGGMNYAAGELGHVVINFDGKVCTCGRRGCFEAYASATALIEQTKEAMEKNPSSALWELCNGELLQVEGKTLFQGVDREDKVAVQVLEQYIQYLSVGLVNIINIFQPEIVCIGGGISKAGAKLIEPLQVIIDRENYARASEKQTKLLIAQLDNDAGIIGAALLKN
jgi:glucokinase